MFSILGAWMLFLLSQGRLAEFHSEIEIIPDLENRYIHYSIELERDLMEGRYHKVWKSRESVPSHEYLFFLDKLSETIRYVCPHQPSKCSL
jgi:26S proteasome regulatory subunit N12